MSSSASLGAHASTSASQAQVFYEDFSARSQDLRSSIDAATSSEALQDVAVKLAALRTDLTSATTLLPAYDRQQHEQRLKQLNELLTQRKSAILPNKGFSFQRRPKVSPTAQANVSTEAGGTSKAGKNYERADEDAPLLTSSPHYLLCDRAGETLTLADLAPPSSGTSSDVHLRDLTNCIVDVRADPSATATSNTRFLAAQLLQLTGCVIYLGSVDGAVMLHGCNECIVVVGCRQFRMHSSRSSTVLVRTFSTVTVEHCTDLRLAEAPEDLLIRTRQIVQAATRHELEVQDFDHISKATPSPNWRSLTPIEVNELEECLTSDDGEGGATKILLCSARLSTTS